MDVPVSSTVNYIFDEENMLEEQRSMEEVTQLVEGSSQNIAFVFSKKLELILPKEDIINCRLSMIDSIVLKRWL